MLVPHDFTKFVKRESVTTLESQRFPENSLVGKWRQAKYLMHFFVLVEVEVSFLVDEEIVGLSHWVKVIELVKVNKLIKFVSWNFARFVIAFLDEPHL